MGYKIFVFFLLHLTILNSCVTPYDVTVAHSSRMVIEGLITDQPGPYTVSLSTTSSFETDATTYESAIRDAYVSIKDDLGREVVLKETNPGIYKTDPKEIRGEVGRTYKLFVKTKNGKSYVSNGETITKITEIDSLYYEYIDGNGIEKEGFHVYLDSKDDPNEKNYYSWKWRLYDEVKYCPYEYEEHGYRHYDIVECCREICWEITECLQCINILADKFIDGNKIVRRPIAVVPYNSRIATMIEVDQFSISKNAYDFLRQVKRQTEGTNSPFSAAPGKIGGNISSLDNQEELVFGFFGASSVKTYQRMIFRLGIQKNPTPLPDRTNIGSSKAKCSSCKNIGGFSRRPKGWIG